MKQNYIIPSWLNKEFLLKVLKTKFGDNLEVDVKDFSIDSATQKGDNYASEMFRIVMNYSLGSDGKVLTESLLLKKNHTDPKIDELFRPFDMYRKEINCYHIYLTEFQKILKTIGEETEIAPKIIYFELDNQIMVVEDKAVQNYRTGDKHKRFDMDCARLTLRKLALYHAASIIYNERENGDLKKVKNTMFSSLSADQMFKTIVDAAYAEVKSWGKDYEHYLKDLEFINEHFLPICDDLLIPSPNMGVFIHGDMWLNNILVQYDDNNPTKAKDILLIDFQLCGWASRAIDLIYFIFTTLSEEDYTEHFDDVLEYYNDQFTATLKRLGGKNIPTFEEFKAEVEKKMFYGM